MTIETLQPTPARPCPYGCGLEFTDDDVFSEHVMAEAHKRLEADLVSLVDPVEEASMTDAQMLERKYAMENEYPHADRCPACLSKRQGKTFCNHCKRDWPQTPEQKAEIYAALVKFWEKWDRDPTATVEEVQSYEMGRGRNGWTTVKVTRPASPPLMIFSHKRLTVEVFESIRADVAEALASGKPIMVDPAFSVFQLVDGRWQQIQPEAKGE